MSDEPASLWPELSGWQPVAIQDAPVFRVNQPGGSEAYLRDDDGSAPVLRQLERYTVPAPRVLDVRDRWILLTALPGIPLHDTRWLRKPAVAAAIIAAALRSVHNAGVTHGDMCLPNILGDFQHERLTGIVDWGYANSADSEIDIASAVWSCGYNGQSLATATEVLGNYGWRAATAAEVKRLSRMWIAHAGEPDEPGVRRFDWS